MSISKQDIKELRGDLSPFLIHLTRKGTYKRWADIYDLDRDDHTILEPLKSLEGILDGKKIEARCPFGYFNFKVPYGEKNKHSKIKRGWLRSVCFTETPVDYIYLQCEKIQSRQFNFAPYGLAFFENSIRKAGGNPVMYFDSKNALIRTALESMAVLSNAKDFASLMVLYEGFGPPLYWHSVSEIDFRWEREWRIRKDFSFDLEKDVAFGICPHDKIETFEKLTGNQFFFIDPRRHTGLIKKKLKQDERLAKLI